MYVGDLDPLIKEEDLLAFFQNNYSSICSCKIITDLYTKQSKGYGFITFIDYEEFQVALNEMNGKMLLGRPMKVK